MKPICPQCKRITLKESEVFGLNGQNTIKLKCGHEITEDVLPVYTDWQDVLSRKGLKMYPFQARSCEFAHASGLRCILTHEMGLGKTIIVCNLLKRYESQMGRTLVVCKASLTVQWFLELFEWAGIMAQRIESSKEPLHKDSFDIVVISMDTLKLCEWHKKETFKTVILDEVQNLKNTSAARTQAAMNVALRADYVIGLSGTPVKNHMAEYYPILHAVRPDIFRSEASFISRYVDSYWTGYGFSHGGARNLTEFRTITKNFILGYTRKEVAPDLPSIQRNFRFLELDKDVDKQYRTVLGQWKVAHLTKGETVQEKFEQKAKARQQLMLMYQIIGLSKVKPTIDFVEDFLDSQNGEGNEKLVLFIEHIAVGDMLESGINKILQARNLSPCIRIRGGISSYDSSILECQFRQDERARILIASTRGCGEGKNFQFCSRAVMVERQWNAANEEQAEARFTRIGSKADHVEVTYMVARKTYDEAHAQLVEKKREIHHKAVGDDIGDWEQSDFMRELMDIMVKS
jgi:SNF2 family DNA or RNA helicase